MRKGISAVVSVVLLIALAVIAAMSIAYWLAGLATKQATPNTPIPLYGVVIKAHAGYITVLTANLGQSDMPPNSTITVAENFAQSAGPSGVASNEQRLLTFWGRYDKYYGYMGFTDHATLYSPTTGSSSPTLALPDIVSNNVTAYELFSAEGFEPSIGITEDYAGILWIAFTSNQTIGSHDIWVMNSTDRGKTWNTPIQAAAQGTLIQEDSPQIVYNGTFYILYRSWYNSGPQGGPRLRMVKSSNGNVWSTPVVTNVGFTDPDGNDYTYTTQNKRGFSLTRDSDGLFWIAYVNGTNVAVRNSSDAITWNAEIPVYGPVSPGKVSLISTADGKWLAYVDSNPKNIGVSRHNGTAWARMASVTDPYFGEACTGPSMISNRDGDLFIFSDQSDTCSDIFVSASTDGAYWSRASWLPNVTSSDKHPSAMQDSNGLYRLAFADADSIHTRNSNDPMIWLNHSF